MNTYHGNPCRKCGETLRYVSASRCVFCRLAAGRARSKAQHVLHDDQRLGLASGFIQFATVQCDILRWIHENRPCFGVEVAQALGLDRAAVSTALRMLQRHGFLHKVGSGHPRQGVRSAAMFSTVYAPFKPLRPKTQRQRQAAYRQRKKLRVDSVFNFRSTISVNGD